jgi:hypothetical protein
VAWYARSTVAWAPYRAAAAAGADAGAVMAQGAFEVLFNVAFGFMFAFLAVFGFATMRLVAARDNKV